MSRTPNHLLECPPAHPPIVDPEPQISRALETPRQRRWLRLQRIHLYPRITASQLGASGIRLDGRSRDKFSGEFDLIGICISKTHKRQPSARSGTTAYHKNSTKYSGENPNFG